MLSSFTILLFSTSVLAIPHRRIEVTYPSLETSRSGIRIMKLRVFDQDIVLNLEPAGDVISDDFAIMDEQGEIEPVDVKSFKGKLFRDQKKGASLHIDEDGFIEIDGIINSKLRIESSESQNVGKYGMKEHVIFETFDEKKHFRDIVYNLNLQRSFSKNKAMNLSKDQCVEIEYVFLAEEKVLNSFPSIEDYVSNLGIIFTEVQNILDTLNLKMKILVLGTVNLVSDHPFIDKSLIPGKDIFNVDAVLKNLEMVICDRKDFEKLTEADIILLFSQREIGFLDSEDKPVVGISGAANIGGACSECSKVGIIKWKEDARDTAVTVAQQSAHLLGSPHDEESGNSLSLPGSPGSENCRATDGFLLGDNSGANKGKFSVCSLENVKYFLGQPQASCLLQPCENLVL
uniref:Metalloprotease n=1 Tax=Tityus melici TaxID=3026321 RepID=A0AA49K9S8_9SCOR|nr:putative metalloprotease [Tityus melici]